MHRRHGLFFAMLLLCLVGVGSAMAAKPSGNGKPSADSISLVLLADSRLSTSSSAIGTPSIGDDVTFSVQTGLARPWVNVQCFQGSDLVYAHYSGFYEAYAYGQVFTLGPTGKWAEGSASCIARLIYFANSGAEREVTRISFDAAA